MLVAKLYAFYEKNDIRMLDKFGNPVLLKIGCTTATTVQKRVTEQSKGTIVSDNVIVWGQNNDKIATWYDGRKDADKDFHNFIKIRKPESYRPDVGSEVFEITVLELEALYEDFVKVHSNAEIKQRVYKVTFENSKIVVDKIFKEYCESVINRQILLEKLDHVNNYVDLRNDSLFLSKFSKFFAKAINELTQNPLSEPGLNIKLWGYILVLKNKFIADSVANLSQGKLIPKMEPELENLYQKIECFSKQWEDFLDTNKRDKVAQDLFLTNLFKCFSYIKIKSGYVLNCDFGLWWTSAVGASDDMSSAGLNTCPSDCPLYDGVEILDPIKGLVELAVFDAVLGDLDGMRYKGPAATDILFCKSAVNKFCKDAVSDGEMGLWYGFKLQLPDVLKIKYNPYIVLNEDGSKSIFILEAYHQTGIYWEEYVIKTDDDNKLISINTAEGEELHVEIEYNSGIIVN